MGMPIKVTSGALATLLEEAKRAHPLECCGLLLGRHTHWIDTVRPVRNVAAQPQRAFELESAALIAAFKQQRAGGPLVIGYYHSHPNGNPAPSLRDAMNAPHDGLVWVIVALGEAFFWRDAGEEGFAALAYRVEELNG
jgi:proteasome lid subunit RPN8/RPN11